VQTHVRSTALVRSSRRNVHGMKAARPQRGQRSGLASGGSLEGNHGTFAVIAPMIAPLRAPPRLPPMATPL
jgi:hypothetical protein